MYYTVTFRTLQRTTTDSGKRFSSIEKAIDFSKSLWQPTKLIKHVKNIFTNDYDRFDMSDLLN